MWTQIIAAGTPGVWTHLSQTVLPEYAANTLWLLAGVGAGVVAVGVGTAWLTSMHEFPGRRAFEWALILPLAMPAYVIADVKVNDPEQYKQYQALSPGAITAAGGEFLVRGGRHEVLEGQWNPHRMVVARFPDYAAAKGAIDVFTLGLAKEVGPEGIRVNAVRPGLIDTEIHASGGLPNRARELAHLVPMQRAGTAEEVARAIVWLMSDDSSYTTGSVIDVTGGR